MSSPATYSDVTHHNTVPELFTVASGSYVSTPTYGSGATHLSTSFGVQVPNKSNLYIRLQDVDVLFSARVTLDLTQASPFGASTDEIRIGTNLSSKFPPLHKVLLQPNSATFQPLFGEVDIVYGSNSQPAIANPHIKARLLYGGELALLVVDPQTGLIPLTVASLPGFNSETPETLVFSIRGNYIG